MPELPEVETIARGLRATLPGRKIIAVRLGKTDFMDDPGTLERSLPGLSIDEVVRYGKFLLLRSEEHTSELQSRLHLVCRLLLEKKKVSNELHETGHTASDTSVALSEA